MRALWRVFRRILAGNRWAMTRGALLAATVLMAGVALLGLSGWFITAAGIAGLAGGLVAFDVFRPSAGVRFLALGRTAARYGERLLTHDATLRGLAALRGALLAAMIELPFRRLAALRSSLHMNRLTMDVDALDGVALRLAIPAAAGFATLSLAFLVLWALVGLGLAAWLLVCGTFGAALGLAVVYVKGRAPSRRSAAALQAFRMRVIDLLRARADLVVYGRLQDQVTHALAAEARLRADLDANDRAEQSGAVVLGVTETLVSAGALTLGAFLVERGEIGPALAALAFFASLALAEAFAPLRRGVAELGRMVDAARRVERQLARPDEGDVSAPRAPATPVETPLEPPETETAALRCAALTYRHAPGAAAVLDGVTLSVAAGETVALTGASGAGKSTLLFLAAGLLGPQSGTVHLAGQDIRALAEPELRARVGLLPQRSALMSGRLREALTLARPDLDDAALWAVLETVCLGDVVRARGGLDLRLGEAGSGLSGGEARRLALARVLVRRPAILLLDEPTEGLDDALAARVLTGIRSHLPEAAVLMASHRAVERDAADRCIALGGVALGGVGPREETVQVAASQSVAGQSGMPDTP